MSGLTVAEIREALAAQLQGLLTVDGLQVNVRVRGEWREPPSITIQLAGPPDYWVSMGAAGVSRIRFNLVIDPAGVDESAVDRLDQYLSAGTGNNSSVIDAVMSDKTLGGLVDNCTLMDGGGYDAVNIRATLLVEILARKIGANV